MTAQYKVWNKGSIVLTKDDPGRIRAFVMSALFCRSLSFCPPTCRVLDGERFVTGSATERLHLGIDFRLMFDRLGIARRERLLEWALGVRTLCHMREGKYLWADEDNRDGVCAAHAKHAETQPKEIPMSHPDEDSEDSDWTVTDAMVVSAWMAENSPGYAEGPISPEKATAPKRPRLYKTPPKPKKAPARRWRRSSGGRGCSRKGRRG